MSLLKHCIKLSAPLFNCSFSSTTRLSNIYYTKDHETIQTDSKTNIVKLGISDYAKEKLGDIVFLEPELEQDDTFEEGDILVSIESVKATSDIEAPFNGKIVDVNEIENVESIATMTEEELWFISCEINDASILNGFMSEIEYTQFVSKKE